MQGPERKPNEIHGHDRDWKERQRTYMAGKDKAGKGQAMRGHDRKGNANTGHANGNDSTLIIENCHSTGDIENTHSQYGGGGICGDKCRGPTYINGCYSTGEIKGSINGGIVGDNCASNGSPTVYINACWSTGDMTGGIGANNCGIVASVNGKTVITNCYSSGDMNGQSCSGICNIDTSDDVVINNCYTSGDSLYSPYPSNNIYSGGKVAVSNCYSTGAILGGGIGGSHFDGVRVLSCYSVGALDASDVGGIFSTGSAASDNISIHGCYSAGTVSGTGAGGICGSSSNVSILDRCYSTRSTQTSLDSDTFIDGSDDDTLLSTTLPNDFGYIATSDFPILAAFTRSPWTSGTYVTCSDHPTLNVSDNQIISLDNINSLDTKTLQSDLQSVLESSLPSSIYDSHVLATNIKTNLVSSDSSNYDVNWDLMGYSIASDLTATQLTLSDISTSNQTLITDYLETYYDTKLGITTAFTLAEGSILAELVQSSGSGGDPYVAPLLGEKIRLENNWKHCLLYKHRAKDIAVIARCNKLKPDLIAQLHKSKSELVDPSTDAYVHDWTYFDRIYLVKNKKIIAQINSLNGDINDNDNGNGNGNIAKIQSTKGLYSYTHNKRYPPMNCKTYEITLPEEDSIVVTIDNYWDDVNHIAFKTKKSHEELGALKGELICHNKANKIVKKKYIHN